VLGRRGWFTLPIARVASRVVAIDIDTERVRVAGVRLREAGVTNCEFIAGDAYDVARLVREPVDLVFIANAFHGVPDRPRLARSVAAVLKSEGRFVIVNWHPRPREETTVLGEPRGPRTDLRLSAQQVIADVTSGGLVFDRLVEVPPYHYAAIFQRAAAAKKETPPTCVGGVSQALKRIGVSRCFS
jgi:SAM-dependent methyltransferase